MKRKEYMERLEQLLLILSEEEREEALQYYNDYFDDAGADMEEQVMEELGSPEEVAAKIRVGFREDDGEYLEYGYEDLRFQEHRAYMVEREDAHDGWETITEEDNTDWENTGTQTRRSKNTNIWKVIAISLILLLASPIILPLGIAAVAVIFTLLVAAVAILGSILLAGFAVLFAGVAIFVMGVAKVMLVPAVGILAMGVGGIVIAIGILLSWLLLFVGLKIVPSMMRWIVNILRKPFRKAGVR